MSNTTKTNLLNKSKTFFSVDLRFFLICCISGAFWGTSAPGYDLWLLAWIGLSPLLIIIALDNSPRKAFIYSLGFGFFYNLVYLGWFAGLFPLRWLGLNDFLAVLLIIFVLIVIPLYQAIFIGLFGTAYSYILKLKSGKIILTPLLWVLIFEILNSLGPLALPWAMVQYSQYQLPTMVQVCDIIGGTGIGYIVILNNTAYALFLLDWIKSDKKNEQQQMSLLKKHSFILGFIALLLFTINIYGYKKLLKTHYKGEFNACITQAAIPVEFYRTGKISTKEQLAVYLNLLKYCPDGVIVFPEGAVSTTLRDDFNFAKLFLLKLSAEAKKSTIITGTYDRIGEEETNAVIAINSGFPDDDKMSVYHKRHLVPFGEYTPFREFLPEPLEKLASISSTRDFAQGKNPLLLNTTFGKAGCFICYEVVFPFMAKEMVSKGAEFLVNVSNLGWFHNSIIDKQFISMCSMRAIENNRYFIVSINNGSSAIISPTGEILALTPKNETSYFSAKIDTIRSLTFYTKWNFFQ